MSDAKLPPTNGRTALELPFADSVAETAEKVNEAAAKQAVTDCGITPLIQPIRGGTDGARLSFMGLPCPNLFAGGHNFHSTFEFVPAEFMEKAVEMIVHIAELATSIDFQKNV